MVKSNVTDRWFAVRVQLSRYSANLHLVLPVSPVELMSRCIFKCLTSISLVPSYLLIIIFNIFESLSSTFRTISSRLASNFLSVPSKCLLERSNFRLFDLYFFGPYWRYVGYRSRPYCYCRCWWWCLLAVFTIALCSLLLWFFLPLGKWFHHLHPHPQPSTPTFFIIPQKRGWINPFQSTILTASGGTKWELHIVWKRYKPVTIQHSSLREINNSMRYMVAWDSTTLWYIFQ